MDEPGDPLDEAGRAVTDERRADEPTLGDDPRPNEAGLSATSGDADPPGGTTQATDGRPPEAIRHAEDGAGVGEGRQE